MKKRKTCPMWRAFFLASEAGELVRESPHKVDEPDDKKERPRHLHEEQPEVHRSTDQSDERIVDRRSRDTNRIENRSCRSVKRGHKLLAIFLIIRDPVLRHAGR